MSTVFWCTPCKTRHPGECPPRAAAPPAPAAECDHDWQGDKRPVLDLSLPVTCSKCGRGGHATLVQVMNAKMDGKPLVAWPDPIVSLAAPFAPPMPRRPGLPAMRPGDSWVHSAPWIHAHNYLMLKYFRQTLPPVLADLSGNGHDLRTK